MVQGVSKVRKGCFKTVSWNVLETGWNLLRTVSNLVFEWSFEKKFWTLFETNLNALKAVWLVFKGVWNSFQNVFQNKLLTMHFEKAWTCLKRAWRSVWSCWPNVFKHKPTSAWNNSKDCLKPFLFQTCLKPVWNTFQPSWNSLKQCLKRLSERVQSQKSTVSNTFETSLKQF